MKWNRSSYVNRLRKSDWLRLFQEAGFRLRACGAWESEKIRKLLPRLSYLHAYSEEDAITGGMTMCAEKPV